jgi:hypothetical protein
LNNENISTTLVVFLIFYLCAILALNVIGGSSFEEMLLISNAHSFDPLGRAE